MTGNALIHRERFEGARRWTIKSFHRAMTSLAIELRYHDVDTMGKEYMSRQTPHSSPRDFLSLLTVAFELFNLSALGISPGMTS